MIRREFIEWLCRAEADFPVTSWRVRDIHVWPLIRLWLSASTLQLGSPAHSLGAGWRRLGSNVAHGLAGWAKTYVGDGRANRRPWEPADAVLLASSIGRRPLVDGKRYDVRSGPYVELLTRCGARSLVWEMSPFGDYNVPRYTPSFLVQPHLIRLRAECQVLPLGDDRVELDHYERFLARVRESGLRFTHADVFRIRRNVFYLRRLADKFAGWLRHSRPRLGFVAGAALPDQAFCLACRELGITSVEVQHGVQGDLHPSYGSWSAVPSEGWKTRARVFWCWDEDSAAAINRWAVASAGQHVAINGGDPWRELVMEDGGEWNRRTDQLIEERKRASGAQRHILITLTSQGDVIPAPVLEAVRSSPAEWCFWFRLHPANQAARGREAKRILRHLGMDLGLLEFATEVPLHALLRRMDGHLSVNSSTVVTEAAALGVASIACGREAPEFYPAEAAAGMLVVATTPSEILAALHQVLGAGRRPVTVEPPRAPGAMRRLLAGDLTAETLNPSSPS